MSAHAIAPKFVAKLWGSTHLAPWFPDQAEKTGEVWFPAGDLLIKFLFTTDDLSVQVHPGDDYAREHESSRGKTEMWHILRAEPGAQVALGFRAPLEPGALAELARTGAIMEQLAWYEAEAGDTFLVPAGTVHAIGRGLALCEIQQNSDVTYRLFDYGRPRELHLEKSMDVSDAGTHPGKSTVQRLGPGRERLAASEFFTTGKLHLDRETTVEDGYWIVLTGSGVIEEQRFHPGTVWQVKGAAQFRPQGAVTLLHTRSEKL